MASTDTTEKPTEQPPPKNSGSLLLVVDIGFRFFLFATALVEVIVMVTSKQTKLFTLFPGVSLPIVAKFSQSPAAFIILVATLSVACLYSVITGVVSVLVLIKPGVNGIWTTTVQSYFVIIDSLLLGIVAAAAGGVGYIGFKGNKC